MVTFYEFTLTEFYEEYISSTDKYCFNTFFYERHCASNRTSSVGRRGINYILKYVFIKIPPRNYHTGSHKIT